MAPVSNLSGAEMNDRTKKPSEQIADFFKKIGNLVHREGFGDVLFDSYGVSSETAHRPLNREKMVTLASVPDVVKNGRQISRTENWKGRGYTSYVFAAPVTINGSTVYVAAVVDQDSNNRYYLHEVVDSNGNYIRISESPSGNTKSGLTARGGITAGPDRLSSGSNADSSASPAAIAEILSNGNMLSQPSPAVKSDPFVSTITQSQGSPAAPASNTVGAAETG